MKKWISNIFYSFPFQLFTLHLRNNLLLLLLWILVFLLMTGTVATKFGIKYLFLTPEYLGEVNFWSFFIFGFSFGAFLMTWNLTTYLLDAYLFPFLASLSRPFTKFCLNNLVIPLSFVIIYLSYSIYFQYNYEYCSVGRIFMNCLGFLSGGFCLVFMTSIYFHFTNKDILSFLKIINQDIPKPNQKISSSHRTQKRESLIKTGESNWRVDTYLTESFKPRLVRSVSHYDPKLLLSVFRQNHLNALVLQLISLVLLVTLGFLIDIPYFRIPAAASLFILLCVMVAITGAITYWFGNWRFPVFILLLVAINFMTSYDIFNHKNKAYGLDYIIDPAIYSYEELCAMCHAPEVEKDKLHTLGILEKWKKKVVSKNKEKPKMLILCVSGGGMKASVWTTQVLQKVDSIMQGKIFNNTVLITGASGGMIGTAYLRELYLQSQKDKQINIYDRKHIDNISKDLLNSITFTIVSNDLFLPWVNFKIDGHTYKKDRGYIFEKQLNENTEQYLDKKLGDYRQAEEDALIPMLFLSPSIVNDGRRMIMSPQGVSYMTIAPIGVNKLNTIETDAVDFGQIFKDQGAQNIRFLTALRMNATYPYILPNVYLPSSPQIEVMDAGFRDNYGIMSATRFIHVFKDWIKENTSGVVLMQVSGSDKFEKMEPYGNEGVIESIFNPLGIASQIMNLQDYEHDANLGYIYDLIGPENFDVIRFIYHPGKKEKRASMTFHLTKREKDDILNSFYLPENQKSLKRLQEVLETKEVNEDKLFH